MAYLKKQSHPGLVITAESPLAGDIPHIQPGVLYPAVANIMLDGATALSAATVGPNSSTVASSKYGTVQADGRMYYYTEIAGSKPIKDPRIGAYFGGQRHRMSSLQLLEQETATHGLDVYSVDGREWIRAGGANWSVKSTSTGVRIEPTSDSGAENTFVEVIGYFNDIILGIIGLTTDTDQYSISLNGGTVEANDMAQTVGDPKAGAFTACVSNFNPNFDSAPTLGINTVKIFSPDNFYCSLASIELIAQDTTDTASKSKIQIPAQTVFSQGVKSDVSATATHYDPFNGFTNSTDLHSAYVDTATSLGLSTAIAVHGAPWAISGTNNIRPYNGGRVVKWVDSDGTIKTSVNVMPPNAQNAAGLAAAEITTPSATNTVLPAFSDDGLDQSLAEVTKSFHWREFGNGARNAGTAAAYADLSMLAGSNDNIAHVLDDGLTGVSGNALRIFDNSSNGGGEIFYAQSAGTSQIFFIFIGTGLTLDLPYDGGAPLHHSTIAQNLPYGTHIYRAFRPAAGTASVWIDGVQIYNAADLPNWWRIQEMNIHQPKMPPIPDDAVVIADYMLMADHVIVGGAGQHLISKGVRRVICSKDIRYDHNQAIGGEQHFVTASGGIRMNFGSSNAASKAVLPAFCTNQVHYCYDVRDRAMTYDINGSDVTPTATTGAEDAAFYDNTGNVQVVGLNIHKVYGTAAASSAYVENIDVVSPIHTSSHYQTFETPYVHELVGGDRNMEQNNLVVTAEGETWDEVTRDTSYIGKACLSTNTDTIFGDATVIFDNWRGEELAGRAYFNKDFAIGYDRVICLVAGQYAITAITHDNTTDGTYAAIQLNGTTILNNYNYSDSTCTTMVTVDLQRKDYIQIHGKWDNDDLLGNFKIDRI